MNISFQAKIGPNLRTQILKEFNNNEAQFEKYQTLFNETFPDLQDDTVFELNDNNCSLQMSNEKIPHEKLTMLDYERAIKKNKVAQQLLKQCPVTINFYEKMLLTSKNTNDDDRIPINIQI